MDHVNVVDYVKDQKKLILEEINFIKTSIVDDLEGRKSGINNICLKMEELKKYVHQYSPTMIAHDIRICNDVIKELETVIKNERAFIDDGKSFKFSFGIGKNTHNKLNKSLNNTIEKKLATPVTDTVDMSMITNSNTDGFKNLSHQELMLDKFQTEFKDIVLESLDYCKIRIIGVPISLRLINLKNSHIFTGPISSSVYIERCQKCVFQIAAQQVRIHKTNECDIYLHVTSRTIIEDSTKLRFGRYSWLYDDLNEDFKRSGINIETNNWKQIDDFNILQNLSSNWSLIE